jgi:hypothetical protein
MPAWIETMLSWIVIGLIGLWTIYAGLVKPVINPNPTTTQHADRDVINPQPHATFGCASVQVNEYRSTQMNAVKK